VPAEELPRQFNPAAGFVVTANHKMIREGYPYKVGYSWADPYRFQRITQVLQKARSGDKLDVEALEHLQSDVLSLPAMQLIERLRTEIASQKTTAGAELLLRWNGEVTRESAAAALYEVWLQIVIRETMNRAVPQPLRSTTEDWSAHQVLGYLGRMSQSMQNHSNSLLSNSLEEAWRELEKLEGPDPATWSWGKLHVVRFRHPLDQTEGSTALLDPGPVPRPGDEYTVNATGYFGNSLDQVSGASYREILDLSDWDHSVAVNTPGQSGQPGSPHYSDLLPLWSEGRYFPLLYSREAVEKEVTDRLLLKP
jgi:penicillin amidase